VAYVYCPNIPNILTPITLKIKIEKISIMIPAIAEVRSSWPALSLSGFPLEDIIIKEA
jgi:hypothetical protein